MGQRYFETFKLEKMEINTRELRIGNLLNLDFHGDSSVFEVGEISGDGVKHAHFSEWPDMETLSPIPLTEDWLLRFGFEKENKKTSIKHGVYFSKWINDYKYSFAYAEFREDWGFYHSYTDALKDEDNDRFDFISCGIKYVHQLQNLFYALTNTELTLK